MVQSPVKLSIIIPVYNAEEFLTDAFRSILAQDIDKSLYEVVVIDDGSTDSSLQVIQRFVKYFNNFKYITQQNSGVSVARNTGLDLATGEYVMFLDSDDTFKPGVLSRVYHLIKGKDTDIYFFGKSYSSKFEEYSPDQFLSTFYFSVYVWNTCIKAQFIKDKDLRFSDGYILEDGIFLLEAIIKASCIGTSRLNLIVYNANEKSLTRDDSDKVKNMEVVSSFIFTINKHNSIINSIRDSMSVSTYLNLIERKECYIFGMFFRMIRYGLSKKKIEENLKQINFDRFVRFPGKYHNNLVYKLLAPIVMKKNLRTVFVVAYRLMKREGLVVPQWTKINKLVSFRHVHLLKVRKLNP